MNKDNRRQYRCGTCGVLYWSSSHNYDERVILDTPHTCPLPGGRFFVRTEVEHEWKEGVLYTRTVTYRKYSGHDTGYKDDIVEDTGWKGTDKYDPSGQGGRE